MSTRDGGGPPPTAHQWVRARLRTEILTGRRTPGARLVQTEIAEEYGTSVTPVREAMRDLINEGLVDFDPHRAARVREVDVDEAVEINDLRGVLEPMAAARAAHRATPAELDRVREIEAAMEAAESEQEWLELNRAFHLTVIEAAHSPRLADILLTLRQISSFHLAAVVRAAGADRSRSLRDHRALIDALVARDAERAAAVMAEHIAHPALLRTLLPDRAAGGDVRATAPGA